MSKMMTTLLRSFAVMLAVSVIFVSFGAAPSKAGDVRSWQTKIVKLVAKKQVYPRAAMRKEIEGRAKVKITIDRSGAIVAHELEQSTGHKVLDKEVPKLMKRISPLPTPPSELNDAQLTFVLPLSWVIQ